MSDVVAFIFGYVTAVFSIVVIQLVMLTYFERKDKK